MTDNFSSVLIRFISELKIPVSRQSAVQELEKHPEYGSLFAYSDLLDKWSVPNKAYKLHFDKLKDISTPFIAFIHRKEFTVVTSIRNNKVRFSNGQLTSKTLSLEKFKKIYSGAILMAEKQDISGELNYKRLKRTDLIMRLRLPFLFIGTLFLLFCIRETTPILITGLSLSTTLIFLTKVIGVVVSVILLIQSVDSNNPLIQKLCGDEDESCSAILNSPVAKLTDYLSWSEIGFFYFSGTLVVLTFNHGNVALINILAILNLLCLPYTFFSIFYQWRIAKQWCIFCCTVQFALWMEFFAFLPQINFSAQLPNIASWINFTACMITPVLFWVFLKPYLLLIHQVEPLKDQLRKFKYNTSIFDKMISEEVRFALPNENEVIIIGNTSAEKIITMIVNPYCAPCAKAYKKLRWLEQRADVKLQIVYSTPSNQENKKNIMASHMMSLLEIENNKVIIKNALDDWYGESNKDYDKWSKLYPVNKSLLSIERLQKQRDWVKLTETTKTPTFFVNGRKIPEHYESDDLKYLV